MIADRSELSGRSRPRYGFGKKLPNTGWGLWLRDVSPARATQNSGHTFQLSWLNRSFACVQRNRHVRDQYEDGYFTLIDHDGGGGHVACFTGESNLVQGANDSYSVQDLTFKRCAPCLC